MKEGSIMLYALYMIVLLTLEYSFFGFESTVIFGLVLILVQLNDIKNKLTNK